MASQCFYPNGTIYNDVIPCNGTAVADGQHSSCCRSNDLCLTNGLCMSTEDHDADRNYYWREGCTDESYSDNACPKQCTSGDFANDNHKIFHCPSSDNTKWTCKDPAKPHPLVGTVTDGCDDPNLVFTDIAPLIYATAKLPSVSTATSKSAGSSATPAASPASTAISASSEPTNSSPSSNTSSSPSNHPSSNPMGALTSGSPQPSEPASTSALTIGLGVGIPLGVISIASLAAVVFLLLRRRRRADKAEGLASYQAKDAEIHEVYTPSWTDSQYPSEKYAHEATTRLHEANAQREAAELPVPDAELPSSSTKSLKR
ncbi:unnamed protein product [Periconia digitata]|uniref:Uncharacterized protein n=1 Tax=Periconia digitata TaxID=1303443 RepID=A0A9W4XSA4_9PLEO|nr:unnamed protein product [Periconia digitata]